MANADTIQLIRNYPTMTIGVGTEVAMLVSTYGQTATTVASVSFSGAAAGLPSVVLPLASGVTLGIPPDIANNPEFDGLPFRVRVAGIVTTGTTGNVTLTLYQVPAASVGQIGAALGVTTAGASGSGNTSVIALAATSVTAGSASFLYEGIFLWDSTTSKLTGRVTAAQILGVNIAPNSGTAATDVATSVVSSVASTGLNFMPAVTFGTANAGNKIKYTEFSISQV